VGRPGAREFLTNNRAFFCPSAPQWRSSRCRCRSSSKSIHPVRKKPDRIKPDGQAHKRPVGDAPPFNLKLREEPTGRSVVGVLLYEFLVLTGTAAAFLLLFGDVANFRLWARWSPLIISALLLGLFLHLRGRSGSLRYLALASISVAAGFVLSVVNIDLTFPHLFGELGPGAVLYFLFVGAVMIVSGVAQFAYFVSRSPVAPEDGA